MKVMVRIISLLGGNGVASTDVSFEARPLPEAPPNPPWALFFMDGLVLPDLCKLGRYDCCMLCIPRMLRRTSKRLSDCLNDLRILCIRDKGPPWSGDAVCVCV